MLTEKEPNDYGVYSIKCLPTNSIYIGETNNIKRRWSEHLETLTSNTHYNRSLQNDFNKYGKDAFVFQVLNRIDGELLMLNKAKCLVLEHMYIKYYKSLFNVYNIRDTMNDYLLYDSIILEKDTNSINPIRKQILNVLSNYICTKDGLLLNIKYVGSLERQFMLNGIIPKDKAVYDNLVNLLPTDLLENATYNRQIKYFDQSTNSVVDDTVYLIKDRGMIDDYLLNHFQEFTDKANIILPTCTGLRKYLLSRKIIKGKLTAKSIKKIFINCNILKNCNGMIPTDYAIESGFIEKTNPCTLSVLGIKHIMGEIFNNKWSNIDGI